MKIKYLKLPISIEEKKAWNKKGFRVVDAKFNPEPEQELSPEIEPEEKPKAKRRSKKA